MKIMFFLSLLSFLPVIYSTFYISNIKNCIESKLFYTPTKLINESLNYVKDDESIDSYINKDKFESGYKEYISYLLKEDIKSYKIAFTYFKNENNNYFIDLTNEPKNVQINFKCNITVFYEFNYEKVFMVG